MVQKPICEWSPLDRAPGESQLVHPLLASLVAKYAPDFHCKPWIELMVEEATPQSDASLECRLGGQRNQTFLYVA